MAGLGYKVSSRPNGGVIVEGINGKPIDRTEFVSFVTYFRKWKSEYPQLKVSRPVEDICQYCFVFANRHRYLANHSGMELCIECDDDGDEIEVVRHRDDDNEDGVLSQAHASDAMVESAIDNSPQHPKHATTTVAEEREVLLLESAIHIRMARAQRSLYQLKIDEAQVDAKEGKEHSQRRYTFVVDYGQNMELPVYNKQQPGCTYYFSPLGVYNLGMVNHAHTYEDGTVREHMYAHVYHEGVGKKGANNVSSLIVKTLRQLNLLRDDSVGGELNIVFDNCSGQNKNNTVLKLAAWLKNAGYFANVNFIFLIVGHTKNAADRLFNSLKTEYRAKNIYTMEGLIEALDASDCVSVIPTVSEDFFDYDALFKDLYRNLTRNVKQNHIFSCVEHDTIHVSESNLIEHATKTHKASKKGRLMNIEQLRTHTSTNLTNVLCSGLNPYKMVELWKNYRPHIPIPLRKNILYAKPDAKVMSMVKEERSDRSVFRAKLKEAKAAGMRSRLESIAFLDDDGNNIAMIDGEEERGQRLCLADEIRENHAKEG